MTTVKNEKPTGESGGPFGNDNKNVVTRDYSTLSPADQLQIFEQRVNTADSDSAWVSAFMAWLDVHPVVFGYADRVGR